MSDFGEQLNQHKDALVGTVQKWINKAESYLSGQSGPVFQTYWNEITSTSKDEFIRDITNLEVTAATTTVVVTTLISLLVASKLIQSPGKAGEAPQKKDKKKKKKKTLSKAQVANREIQAILDKVEAEFVPLIDKYIEEFETLTEDKKNQTFNYIQEMLLKELMKLDGVDVGGNDVLRENRKKVIRYIQEHQAKLDNFKKEH